MGRIWKNRPFTPLRNGDAPVKGPGCVFETLDFSSDTNVLVDMANDQRMGNLQFVQTLWIDNALNAAALTITLDFGQVIRVAAGSWGYYPVLSTPIFRAVVSTTAASGLLVTLGMINVAIDGVNNAAGGSGASGSALLDAVLPVMVSIGDSQMGNSIVLSGTSGQYVPVGIQAMARRVTNQALIFPLANQRGVGGTQIAAIKATAAAAVATGATIALWGGGINDSTVGLAGLAGRQLDVLDTFDTLIQGGSQGGMLPFACPLMRRQDGIKNANTDAFCDAMTAWLYGGPGPRVATSGRIIQFIQYASAVLNPASAIGKVIVLDFRSLVAANNEPLAEVLQADGLHFNSKTALTAALQIKRIMTVLNMRDENVQPLGSDLWAAQVTNHGLLAGTGGFALATQNVGTVATGWQGNYSGGTAAFVGTWSKIPSLLDGTPDRGQRVVVVTSSGGSTATEQINLQCLTQLTAGFAAGDKVYAEMAYRVIAPANSRGLHLTLNEVGPASPQNYSDSFASNAVLNVAHSGKLRTPVMTLQALITGLTVTVFLAHNGAGGLLFGGTYEFSDIRVMKR